MTYPEPPWSGYPHPSYPPSPHVNESESMLLGSFLGELLMGQAQTVQVLTAQTEVLREIRSQLSANAALMAERLHAPTAPSPAPGERMTWRDWSQIVIAGLVVGGALAGKIPLKDAIGAISKPFGF